MYGKGIAAGAATLSVATVLPNTGSDLMVTIALSAAAGLVTWGTLYALANK